jgi:exonuclease VII small subunit
MRIKVILGAILIAGAICTVSGRTGAQDKKEYLTEGEADKIRDAQTDLSLKIKLFITFADDRIAKFKYTLAHPSTDRNRADVLNGLMNGYSACIDDAADLIDVAKERQKDVRTGLKAIQTKGKDFLTYLQELEKSGTELDSYKLTLDDAIDATKDAISDAEKAEKEIAAPVRRKQ